MTVSASLVIVLESPIVTVLVLLVTTEPPMEVVVVIELKLVPGGVSVDHPVDMPPAVVVQLLLALLVVIVVVELVLVTVSPSVDRAPDPMAAVMPHFVITTGVPSWPLFAVQSRNLLNSALIVVSSDTSWSSWASHLIFLASTE